MEKRRADILGSGAMRCPECKKSLPDDGVRIQVGDGYIDVESECDEGHTYFARIRDDDWLETP